MSGKFSRRKLLGTGAKAIIAGGATVCAGPVLQASEKAATMKGVD